MNMQIKTSLSLSMQNSQNNSSLWTSQNIFSDIFVATLAKDESLSIELISEKSLTLNVWTWWIIYYFDENSASGMIFSSSWITQTFSWEIILTGFWGKNPIEIIGLSGSEFPYNYYQKIQTIWWTQIIQQFWKKSQ